MNLIGGMIGVNSQQNFGSEFWFLVPLKKAAQGVKAVNTKKAGRNMTKLDVSKKILVVDDHPVNRLFAKKLLFKLGFADVDMADDGMQAIEKISSQTYDLVFMDCQMPNLDGYQATGLIREMEKAKGEHISIIAMTANAMNGDREKCLRAGMDDYISKPIKAEKLFNIIAKFIDVNPDNQPSGETRQNTINIITAVDMDHLRMFTDGNKKEEREFTSLFFEQAKLIIQCMSDALDSGDNDSWKGSAHKLKGAAGNFGANKLSNICFEAEKNSHGTNNDKRELYKLVLNELKEVSGFMDYHPEWLNSNIYAIS